MFIVIIIKWKDGFVSFDESTFCRQLPITTNTTLYDCIFISLNMEKILFFDFYPRFSPQFSVKLTESWSHSVLQYYNSNGVYQIL